MNTDALWVMVFVLSGGLVINALMFINDKIKTRRKK